MRDSITTTTTTFFFFCFLLWGTAAALRTEVTVKGLTTTPALLATFGFRITGNATISAAAAESADLSAVNVTLCTAAQLKTISASGDALSARRLRDACEWTGGLGATHVVQHTAEYAAYAWLSSSLGSAVDATLHVLLLNPSARYAQLPLGDAPLPVAALVLVVIWGAAAAAWGAVCAWARRQVAGPHVFVLAMLGGKAAHMALAAAFWAHYAASGLRDTALHTIVLLLEAVCETGLFALLLVLAEGWRIVTPASSHASWHRMRSAFLMLLMLLASLVINAFWNGAYSMLTVIVVYFFLLPRAFAAVARSLRLLFTYRALFAALGLRTRQLRVKLRAMRSIRGMVVFYLVATLLALAFDVMLPFFVSPWVGVIFRESARIIVVVALAVIINPIDRPVVLADVNHLEHIDELPEAMAARAGGARAAAAAAEDAGRARYEAYAERVEKGDVVVFELPPIPGQQGPRLALGTRRSNPAEDGSTTPRALTDAASASKSSEALKSSPS